MLVAEKNRLRAAPKALRREVASLVRVLERHIERIEEKLDASLAMDPERQETAAADSIIAGPGIGISSWVLRSSEIAGILSNRSDRADQAPYRAEAGGPAGAMAQQARGA